MPRRKTSRWAYLPSELVMQHVLVCLPLPKIFEFRIVCRSWACHLSSPTFLHAWSTHPVRRDEEPCLVMAQHSRDWSQGHLSDKTLVAYFPSLDRYVHLPLHANIVRSSSDSTPGMSITSHISSSQHQTLDFTSVSVKTMASAGGLICTIMHMYDNIINDSRDYTVLVFNPLNGNLKVLPPSPKRPSSTENVTSTHMLVNPYFLSYKVFIHLKDAGRFSLQVYDSLEGSWTSVDPPSVCDRFPYGIAHADLHFWDNTHKVIYGYHAYNDIWSTVYFNTEGKGFSPDNLTWANFESPCIMAYNGRLIFALIIRKILVDKQKAHLFGFAVYELQVSKDGYPLYWKRIARTPEHMLEENHFYKESVSFACNPNVSLVHSQKLIFMTCSCTKRDSHKGGHFTRSAKKLLKPIAYDLENAKWIHIPNYEGRQDMAGLFSCKLMFDSFP